MIFGNISSFITDEILDNYDRILSRGHFTLYRNNLETNLSFLLSNNNNIGIPSYETVFASNDSFSFDEWGGVSRIWKAIKNDKFFNEILFDDIAVLKGHFVSSQKQKSIDVGVSHVIFEYNNGTLFRWYIQDGKLSREKTMYAHFQKRIMDVETNNLSHYLIIPNKFINYEEPTINLLKKYGKRQLIYPHAIKLRWNNLLRKIKKLR